MRNDPNKTGWIAICDCLFRKRAERGQRGDVDVDAVQFKAAVHRRNQKRCARCRTVNRPSVRDDGPGFTPNIQIALSPSDGSQPKPNWAWELSVGNHSIDGGSAQAGDPHHRWHAQENG